MASNRDHENGEHQPLLPKQGPQTYEQKHHRNQTFSHGDEPFKTNRRLHLNGDEVNGAFWFMNPTRATFSYHGDAEGVYDDGESDEYQANNTENGQRQSDVQYKWTSRNNRKGRHSLVVHDRSGTESPYRGLESVLSGISRMATHFNFWDISYVTAVLFTLAVVILLSNAVLSAIPYIDRSWTPPQAITYIEAALTLVGCCFFSISSFLSWLEALNADRQGCFGWKEEEVSSTDATVAGAELGSRTRLVPDWNCIHKRNNYSNLLHDESKDKHQYSNMSGSTANASENGTSHWRWLPSLHDLRTYFIYDLGFVTCSLLLLSSLIYCSAAFASFLSTLLTGTIPPWIRILQLIAGLGFILSSILFMIETQTHWIIPEWNAIGWHISFWNFVGSVGFTLCAAFAIVSAFLGLEWTGYQLAYSYLWGSLGFFLGSLLQWYESLDKHPVERKTEDE